MKKTTKKTPLTSPAITKAAKTAATATKPVTPAPAPAPATVAKKAATAAAPAKKKTAAGEPPATFITARVDIGFGNSLSIRGVGPGLSWDRGLTMECIGADLWAVTLKKATGPISFKVLVNDLSWSTGSDYVVEPGQSLTITPTF